MAIKQALAVKTMEAAAGGKVVSASLSEVTNGWVALVIKAADKKLVCVTQGECPLTAMWAVENSCEQDGLHVDIMSLNANNAAVIRRFVKWAAPSACGTKGTSIGFSDWLGAAGGCIAPLFAKKQVKPVLAEYSAADSVLLKRNFLEAVDAATWGVFETGYKEGYGANAEGLKSEEDIVKALLYGYSMIGLDCSDKIKLQIEKMSDAEVEKRYNDFPQEFRDAMQGSYLEANFQVGSEVIHFEPEQLRRIVLEYGEAIMHAQFIYNSYLKNTPWEIDFELLISKEGKLLSPQEHYLIANELQRNGIKFAALGLNTLDEAQLLQEMLQTHAAIADTFGYRLSFLHADLTLKDLGAVAKTLKGKDFCFFDYLGTVALLHLHRCFNQILQHCHMRKQVKLLKHHSHFTGNSAAFVTGCIYHLTCAAGISKQLTVNNDRAPVDSFQLVQTAQQSTFTAAAGTDDGNDFAFFDIKIYTLQNVQFLKTFMNITCFDFFHGLLPSIVLRKSFFQFVKSVGQNQRHQQIKNTGYKKRRNTEITLHQITCRPQQIIHCQNINQRSIFDQSYRLIADRRQDNAKNLRQNNTAHGLYIIHTQSTGRFILAFRNSLDTGAENFAEISGIIKYKRKNSRLKIIHPDPDTGNKWKSVINE